MKFVAGTAAAAGSQRIHRGWECPSRGDQMPPRWSSCSSIPPPSSPLLLPPPLSLPPPLKFLLQLPSPQSPSSLPPPFLLPPPPPLSLFPCPPLRRARSWCVRLVPSAPARKCSSHIFRRRSHERTARRGGNTCKHTTSSNAHAKSAQTIRIECNINNNNKMNPQAAPDFEHAAESKRSVFGSSWSHEHMRTRFSIESATHMNLR